MTHEHIEMNQIQDALRKAYVQAIEAALRKLADRYWWPGVEIDNEIPYYMMQSTGVYLEINHGTNGVRYACAVKDGVEIDREEIFVHQ